MGSLTSPMKHLPPVPPSAARKSDAAATERVAEMTCSLQEMVQDAASCFARVAGGAASYLGQKSEIAAAVVGSGLKSLGNTLRAHAPETGTVGQASATMAESLETTGRYLRGERLGIVVGGMTNLIRRNPISAVLIGVGVGVVICRATMRRSSCAMLTELSLCRRE